MSEAERSHNIEFLAATHIGRLFEQREMLTEVLDTMLAEHARLSDHSEGCPACRAGRAVLAEVQRLKQKYG